MHRIKKTANPSRSEAANWLWVKIIFEARRVTPIIVHLVKENLVLNNFEGMALHN
jgi:hypothetical protein